ncbi:fatty acid desaturase [Citromicrobium bathyomarinum]|uniref:fatty acid desaturase n=1 Tax=Citromicrobium bathyomarinum TaxID=72174 RepID=UPI00315B1B2D
MSRAFLSSFQPVVGLALALAILGGWIALHGFALLAFDLSWETLPLALGMVAVLCWLSVGLFIVSHDAMHGSLVPGAPRLNTAIGTALLFLYAGFSYDKLRAAHWEHHKAPGTDRDPDFAADHPRAFWPWYATFLRCYFGLGSFFYVTAIFWVLHFALEVSIVQAMVFYAVPSIASSLQLFYFGTFRPHRHGEDTFVDRHNARSDNFGTLASFVTCYHFGYHLEHHHHPHVPWWALPDARREARAQPIEEGAGA